MHNEGGGGGRRAAPGSGTSIVAIIGRGVVIAMIERVGDEHILQDKR